MIRQIVVWLREFLNKLLEKTCQHPKYTVRGNTVTGPNTYGIYVDCMLRQSAFYYDTCTNTDTGIWLSASNLDFMVG